MRFLYTVLFYLALPFIFLRLLWRSRFIPGYRQHWLERFGFCPFKLNQCIWIHAVSVGETIAAVPLIKALKKEYSNLPIVVTNTTPTGAAHVKAEFNELVLQAYIPYDLPGSITRFLKRTQPRIVIVMETELWPNLFALCHQQNIPILIANARLSKKSAKGYASFWLTTLRQEMFAAIHILAAQSRLDADRFSTLGMPKKKIRITGNLKFDLELPASLAEKSAALHNKLSQERLIWIAASTHSGEEEIILAAHRLIREKNSSALLVLVPRHPDRFESVTLLVKQKEFAIARRSRDDVCTTNTAVYLGDTMGELLLMYSVADVAFVGGSFAKVGGHNMLEPAVLQKPIITGPILFNFAEISQLLLDAKGMMIVNNAKDLAECVLQFFNDADLRKTVGQNAYQVVAVNRGALQRQVDLIKSVLSS